MIQKKCANCENKTSKKFCGECLKKMLSDSIKKAERKTEKKESMDFSKPVAAKKQKIKKEKK